MVAEETPRVVTVDTPLGRTTRTGARNGAITDAGEAPAASLLSQGLIAHLNICNQ